MNRHEAIKFMAENPGVNKICHPKWVSPTYMYTDCFGFLCGDEKRVPVVAMGMGYEDGYEIYSPKPNILSDEEWEDKFYKVCSRILENIRKEREKGKC